MPKRTRLQKIAGIIPLVLLIVAGLYMYNPPSSDSEQAAETEQSAKEVADSETRIRSKVERALLHFPPRRVLMLADKTKRTVDVYGFRSDNVARLITTYPFTGFSGELGPKLKEGDRQIPEGIYDISALNPESKFHLSIRVDYPNAFDKRVAAAEGRSDLGGDIYIHGGRSTIGCIPIGNDNIEELFYLVKKTGLENTEIAITPGNLTNTDIDNQTYKHPWQKELYWNIVKYTEHHLG